MDEVDGEIGGSEAGLPSSWRFSYDVATSWEKAFFESRTPNTRKIAMRSAIVMSPDRGGAFATLLKLYRSRLVGAAVSRGPDASGIHDPAFVTPVGFLTAHPVLSLISNLSSPQS